MSKIIHIHGKIRKVHPAFRKGFRKKYLPNLDDKISVFSVRLPKDVMEQLKFVSISLNDKIEDLASRLIAEQIKNFQKENAVNLDQDVRNAVNLMVASQQAFTTVDISHPIIAKDSNVRHRNIRDIVNKMLNDGEFESAGYTTSMITVYPQPGSPQTARLFHPDDPNFDPNSYTSTQQELNRNQSPAPVGRQINISDGDIDDNQVAVTSTPSGNPITVQCQIQNINNTLNIPRYLIKRAGFGSGDYFTVSNSNHNNGNSIRIQKSPSGSQTVDIEGRIRIYNPNLKLLNKDKGQTVNAVLVNSAGDNYIEIF